MKFGKRLAAEAARRWTAHYLDYKAIKKAIKDDIRQSDAAGGGALRVLLLELRKVSSFYLEKGDELEARLEELAAAGASVRDGRVLAQVRADISALIKFVALNYLAVVKSIKKRNRHFKAHFGDGGAAAAAAAQQLRQAGFDPLHPLDLLSQEVFFTSNRLAGLATRAEVLSREGSAVAGVGAAAAPLQRSSCHRLVVAPRRGPAAGPHGCPLCPSNLCKGDEVAALSAASCYRRVVFAGDGANDICPALRLGPADAVLARRGHALAAYLEAAAAGGGGAAPAAAVHYWETHDQLAALVELLTSPSGGCGGPGGLPN